MADAEDGSHRNLGRGLSALLGDENDNYASLDRLRLSKMVAVEFLHPCSFQPRKHFDDEAFASLVASVQENGVLQPILVRRHRDSANEYEIIAGERRWRAAQQSQLHEVPVIIKDLNDSQTLEIALVENLQREDLTPMDEAHAYQRLMAEYGRTQDDTAQAVGKSRSHVANMLRLLSLPEPVQVHINAGQLSAGHARALIGTENPEVLAKKIVRSGLNVRQAEALAKQEKKDRPSESKKNSKRQDPNIAALEHDLCDLLGLQVEISVRGAGGALTVRYETLEQLDDLLHRLSHDTPRDNSGHST
jgi:ParB family chromosome partitioning protein